MRSIKPGRGPSMMGGVMAVFVGLFGIGWTFAAASMGAPFFFPLFGIGFVIIAGMNAVYNFKNASSKNRYSAYDITEDGEEIDPLHERFGAQPTDRPFGMQPMNDSASDRSEYAFCPYCGNALREGDVYCSKCGRKM